MVVVSPPSFTFSLGIGQAREPISVQAFGAELAIERFRKRIIRWFAWPGKVELNAVQPCPKIKVFRNEFWPIVHPDAFRPPIGRRNPLQRRHDIGTAIVEPCLDRRTEPCEVVDDAQHTDLATVKQLVG